MATSADLPDAAGAGDGDHAAVGAEVGEHRQAARERGADELLERARLREGQAVGDGLADHVGGEPGAQAGGDEALLGGVGGGGAAGGGGRGDEDLGRRGGATAGAS